MATNLEKLLKTDRKKLKIGLNSLRRQLKKKTIELVYLSNDCQFLRISQTLEVEVLKLECNSKELSNYFYKNYNIRVISLLKTN